MLQVCLAYDIAARVPSDAILFSMERRESEHMSHVYWEYIYFYMPIFSSAYITIYIFNSPQGHPFNRVAAEARAR